MKFSLFGPLSELPGEGNCNHTGDTFYFVFLIQQREEIL